MNLAQVARMLSGFTAFFTLAQIPPLVLALQAPPSDYEPVAGFIAGLVVGGVVSTLLWLAGKKATGRAFRKEAIAVAGLAWFLASLLGAIPFQWSGLLPNPIDAVFEATSGLTTCGATVLGTGGNPLIESVPQSLLLWRALTQWIGGLGIVLVFVALLPAMGGTGKSLITSETVGVSSESFQPRVIEKARLIGTFYLVATCCCALLLVLVGGFPWFDAVCHAFTTLSTGGYSTRASLAEFHSLGGEIVIIAFMFLGGCSFAVLVANRRARWRTFGALARTAEFRLYALVTCAVIAAITVSLYHAGLEIGPALRQATFNGVSILTSTGYATADFQAWPTLAMVVLFCCMLVGGCTGSTAGGLKQVRLLVVLRLSAYTIRHFVRPKSIERIKLDNEVLSAATISSIVAIVLLWFITIVIGALLASLDTRLNFVAALSSSASILGSTGPALTLVDPATASDALLHGSAAMTLDGTPNIGPFGGYGDLHNWTKVLFSVEMVLGRLELLTLLALFSPSFWRR